MFQSNSSFWFDEINLGWSVVYIEGSQVIISPLNALLSLKIVFVITNSVDPDELPSYAATFHLGKNAFSSHYYTQF